MIKIKDGAVKRVHPAHGWVMITNPEQEFYSIDVEHAIHVWVNGNWHVLTDFGKQLLKQLYGGKI